VIVVEKGLVPSRAKAQALIMAGEVRVDGKIINKAGSLIPRSKLITIIKKQKYVSRGGG